MGEFRTYVKNVFTKQDQVMGELQKQCEDTNSELKRQSVYFGDQMAGIKASVDALLDIQKHPKENVSVSKLICSLRYILQRRIYREVAIQQRAREIQEAKQRAR